MSATNPRSANPYRSGYCDFIFNRPCNSPWAQDGFRGIIQNAQYLNGHLTAQEAGIKFEACEVL